MATQFSFKPLELKLRVHFSHTLHNNVVLHLVYVGCGRFCQYLSGLLEAAY